MWSWSLGIGGVNLPSGAALFENAGFGVVHTTPQSFDGAYPQKTMQYMAKLGSATVPGDLGVYVAAHDPRGTSKTNKCTVTPSVDGGADTAAFAWGATAAGAGVAFDGTPVEVGFEVVVELFEGGWWEAAQIYRGWALADADWTKAGPLSKRSTAPKWLFNLTTWINSHWQGNDIFNVTGGDPTVVEARTTAIINRFGIAGDALALHWYEWDALGYAPGSDYENCNTGTPNCGFDTHYPEYFPVRKGFADALKNMQDLGVRVAPYINGRIFDVGTDVWKQDNAEAFACKQSAEALVPEQKLELYNEQYGSQAQFAVMCPHTTYWQKTISSVVGELVNKFGTDGVYIDQIAAAGPRPCWDPTHNHTLGGGSHWVSGYAEMLAQTRAAAGNDAMLLTESNAEPFMDGVNLFLTLVGYSSAGFAGDSYIVPAFQSVYGGYMFTVGAEFFQDDLAGGDPDVFAAKIAKQYVFGSQMGWFSLGGRDNQNPAMGLFELLMSESYDSEISFLRALSSAKQVSNPWMNHGRALRALPLVVDGVGLAEVAGAVAPVHPRSGRDAGHLGLVYSPVDQSAWLSEAGDSILATFTTVKRSTAHHISLTIDAAKFGFPNASVSSFQVTKIGGNMPGAPGPVVIGSFPGNAIKVFDGTVPARSVLVFKIAPSKL